MEIKIYALYDPTSSTIRYIGRTKQLPSRRLAGHLTHARNGSVLSHKDNWIRSLLKNGIRPKIKVLKIFKDITWEESHKIERLIIQKHFKKHNLVNGDDRGPGYTGAKNITQEQRDAMTDKLKSFYITEDSKRNFYNVIHCYDESGNFYKSYRSAFFASTELHIPVRKITNHRNKRDNYNAHVNSINGYNFSKHKKDKVPVYTKANRNVKDVEVINRNTKESIYFKTFGDFINYYKFSEWDQSEYSKGRLTQRMKNFLIDYMVKAPDNSDIV